MKTNWSNKSPPIYAIQLFRSHNCRFIYVGVPIFKCKPNTCIHNNNDNTPIHLHSLNNLLPSSRTLTLNSRYIQVKHEY